MRLPRLAKSSLNEIYFFHLSPFFGSETVSKAITAPTRLTAAQARNGDLEEDMSYSKPPIVAPMTKPAFRKPLKIPMPLPLREAGTRLENIAVIEGLEAARPKPLNIMMNSKDQNPPENMIKTAETAATIMPKMNVDFLPVLSANVPIGKAVISVTVPMTEKRIPTPALEIFNSSSANTDNTGWISELEKETMRPAVQRPRKVRG